ncbi:MAG: hypothetical protein FWE76_02535 [Symbiobacteriaceae bacterium]|nr:hypothetical protein [Symbiobacteriaceae bacterium]
MFIDINFYPLASFFGAFWGGYWQSWFTMLTVASVGVAASLLEMRTERFRNALARKWRKVQVDLVRAELRAKERAVLAVRGRPTFQRDRLRRMQAAQKDFLDELTRGEGIPSATQQDLVDQALKAFTRYYELLQKEQRVASLLETVNRSEIERDIARLEKQADATSSEARTQYLRAAEFRKQELKSLERAEQLSTVMQAHMDALESALATLRTRMINSTVWEGGTVNVYADLAQELLALERAFQEVADMDNDPLLELQRFEHE